MFTLEPQPEIHLERAPLAKVLTQVAFSRTPQLVEEDAEARLAELLPRYPVRRRSATVMLAVTQVGAPAGAPSLPPTMAPLLSFSDVAETWTVTVTENSVALETTAYDSREDFCLRAGEVLAAVAEVSAPPVVDRLGIRYIDRITEPDDLGRIGEYIIPGLRAMYGDVGDGLSVQHSVTDTIISLGDDQQLRVRSGFLPAGGMLDPALPAHDLPSWLLDLDVFSTRRRGTFSPGDLALEMREYAEYAYAFFRYATTPAFQEAFREPRTEEAVAP